MAMAMFEEHVQDVKAPSEMEAGGMSVSMCGMSDFGACWHAREIFSETLRHICFCAFWEVSRNTASLDTHSLLRLLLHFQSFLSPSVILKLCTRVKKQRRSSAARMTYMAQACKPIH